MVRNPGSNFQYSTGFEGSLSYDIDSCRVFSLRGFASKSFGVIRLVSDCLKNISDCYIEVLYVPSFLYISISNC